MNEPVAADSEVLEVESGGQLWLVTWHEGGVVPDGKPHGSAGICTTESGDVVLVSSNGEEWDLPAGRPEGAETWEQTLRREMWEEACATVVTAQLLGFCRGRCARGHEQGLVLVRALWHARVELSAWVPMFEITHRKLVPIAALFAHLPIEHGYLPIYRRAMLAAGLPSGSATLGGRGESTK